MPGYERLMQKQFNSMQAVTGGALLSRLEAIAAHADATCQFWLAPPTSIHADAK